MLRRALPLAFACGLPVHAQGDSLTGPGVSESLARYRAQRIADVRYDLHLAVTEADTAYGRVSLRFQRRRPGDVIVDFRGPALSRVRVNGRLWTSPDFNGAHLRIPASRTVAGENRVDIEFATMVAAAGASIIRVKDPADARVYLYTLLVPSDANQLFPCFDQPDLKGKLTLTLSTPPGWTAVGNGARVRTDSTSRGLVHLFRESEPISTYLMAFAAGPWAQLKARDTRKPMTLYVRQSRVRDVDVDSILIANDRAATWLEQYFGSPFPFHKFDAVLAPAFPFGGMEHPGAIFYSEERFIFRERPALAQRLGRTATIYHEVAHQWFGDLVTMQWFDDLWLKEGFATYMAAKMQAALDPGAEAWKTFYLRNKPAAYAVDATEGTTPVWQQLDNLDRAKSNYGAIVYNKAPSVLKQLNFLVGDSAFRAGVQRFLRKHAYANATWRDLLDAIGTTSGRSLVSWGESWILRPGMPTLSQRLEVRDGRVAAFTLVQRPVRSLSGPAPWPIRTELLVVAGNGDTTLIPLQLNAETTSVDALVGRPTPAFVFANHGDYAYGLIQLDAASVAALERPDGIGTVKDPFLRSLLWGALWDMVRDAVLAPERFVRLSLREVGREADEQLVGSLLGRLTRAVSAYLGEVHRNALLPEVERTLIAGVNDASRPYGIRKAHLDAFIRVVSTEPGRVVVDGMLDSTTIAGDSLRAPTRWALVTRLVAAASPTAQRRLEDEVTRDRTPEGARRAFVARAAHPDPAVKAEYFRRYFADRDLNEDWATASLDAFNGVEVAALTRPYLVPALDSLAWIQKNRRIFYLGSWIASFLEGQTNEEALEEVRRFLAARPTLASDLRSKILQSLDELERTVRIRRTFAIDAPRASMP